MKAHGVPWLRRHLAGELSLEDAAAQARKDTRHYARRQVTWFRHQMPGWTLGGARGGGRCNRTRILA